MKAPEIRDLPQFKKLRDEIKSFKSLKIPLVIFGPLLRFLGTDTAKLHEILSNATALEAKIEELSSLPDRFNDVFATRGWIYYDFINLEIAKAATEKAESGDVDGAECDLVEYFNGEAIEWQLQRMWGVQAFRERMPLAEKALIDYKEERYHACVPVVLALLDGMVNEAHENRRGFFSDNVDLTAWNSVAAHEKGLQQLVNIFQKGRRKTTSEQISIPYRNGILHGMDLGYDNKLVATKTWAALFATRDWAIRAERRTLEEPEPEPEKTWSDLFQQLKELDDSRKLLEAWKPRSLQVGIDLPATGGPEEYTIGTPERKLVEFLQFWKSKNFGHMSKCLPIMLGYSESRAPVAIRSAYAMVSLQDFEIVSIKDEAAAITEITVRIHCEINGASQEKVVDARMFCEDNNGESAISGQHDSRWSILNWGHFAL